MSKSCQCKKCEGTGKLLSIIDHKNKIVKTIRHSDFPALQRAGFSRGDDVLCLSCMGAGEVPPRKQTCTICRRKIGVRGWGSHIHTEKRKYSKSTGYVGDYKSVNWKDMLVYYGKLSPDKHELVVVPAIRMVLTDYQDEVIV